MAAKLRRACALVLDVCDLACRHARPAGQDARGVRGRRRAGELAEVAVEVRLVGVPARVGDVGQALARVRAQRPRHAVEAQDPGDGLRRKPDLGVKPRREMAPAPPLASSRQL